MACATPMAARLCWIVLVAVVGLLLTAAPGGAEQGVGFSELPADVREAAHVYDPRPALQTDNPFGVFAHNELPAVELVHLLADIGLGHAKLPQSDPAVIIPLSRKLGLDLVIFSGLPRNPKRFHQLIARYKGEVQYYQTDGDEPNNAHVKPLDFVKRMRAASVMLRRADPQAKLIMDDLGDEHTARYFAHCLDVGLADAIDYASYGYFTWGGAKQLFGRMRELAGKHHMKLFLAPLQQFGNGGSALHKHQKHLIDFYFCGAELINLYKLIDWAGQFGMLRMDGMLTANYAGLQTLCQFVGRDLPPDRKLSVDVMLQGHLPMEWRVPQSPAKLAVEPGPGWDVQDRRVWVRSFRNDQTLLLCLWYGPRKFNWRFHGPSGVTARLTLGTTAYRYPVAIDLITGRLHDLPYHMEGQQLVIEHVPVDSYARAVLLLKHHPQWEKSVRKQANPREQKPDVWQSVTDVGSLPGEWITAILPDKTGAVWIGLCPMERSEVAIAHVDNKRRVKPIPFANPDRTPWTADITGQAVIKLLPHADKIEGLVRGHFFRFSPGSNRISDFPDPGRADKLFKPKMFTDAMVWKDRVWLTALGTAREGNVEQGEGVAVFDRRTNGWKTYTHRRAGELATKPVPEWSGRVTGIASTPNGLWISAMGRRPSVFLGGKWHQLPAPAPLWSWCVASAGRQVFFGGTDQIVRAEVERNTASSGHLSFRVHIDSAEETGLSGRILHAAVGKDRLWFTTRYSGIAALNLTTGKWTTWLPGQKGLPIAMVEGILPVKDHVWIWTWGGGIARLNLAENLWKITTRREGLVDNRVSTLVEEPDGTVWVGTFRGLSIKHRR